MSQRTAPPGRHPRARRSAAGRAHARARRAMMSAGMPAEKSMDFWPSAKRLLAPAAAGADPVAARAAA